MLQARRSPSQTSRRCCILKWDSRKGRSSTIYIRIAPVLLPHLKGRPITLKRYPEGVNGFFFYEKRCPSHRPSWVKTAAVPSRREEKRIDYCVIDDLPALIWAANLA